MEYRTLGKSGIKVSPLCLGAMMFGGPSDEATSRRIITRAREAGINFIDTADQYNGGKSEEVVGRAIKTERESWVVATKLGNPMGPGPNERGLSRGWMHRAIEASLRRLGTDYVDIYYFHREDADTPLQASVAAMGDLVASGKVRYFGLSNFRAWRIAEICRLCDELGIERPIVSQPYYNAMNRMPEVEQLPVCAHYGLGVVPYSPLARGVLTGKYLPNAALAPESRAARKDKRMMETEWRHESLEIAQKVKARAESKGMSAGQFALNWVLNNALVTAAIVGPRTEPQLEDYLAALAHPFTLEDEAFVDALVPPGHPSTPGYNDPAYPLEGRIARSTS